MLAKQWLVRTFAGNGVSGGMSERSASQRPHPRQARIIGGLVGLGVGLVLAVAAAVVGLYGSSIPPGWSILPAVVNAAAIGGWVVGPVAWRTHSKRGWVGVVLVLGLLAVVIGDVAVIAELVAFPPSLSTPPPDAMTTAAGALFLGVIGLLIVGPVALPFTLGAALIWSLVVIALRRRLDRGAVVESPGH
jgi:hypothetical protein